MMMTGQCCDRCGEVLSNRVVENTRMVRNGESAEEGCPVFGIGKAGRQKETPQIKYDPECQRAVIRCSICTGEQVAGFQDIHSGKFEEVMLIRVQADLQRFKEMYGVEEVAKIY